MQQQRIDIAALVGSAVPASLRVQGVMACWRVLVDGEAAHCPFLTRAEAEAWCNAKPPCPSRPSTAR